MIYIYNRDEEQIDIIDIKPKFTREIGKFNTLEFETIKEYEKGYRVVYQYKGKPYEFIIQEQDYLRDDMVSFSYFCKDSFVENEGVPILDKRPEGSYKVALNSVLEDTRWELVTGSNFSETLTFFNSFYQVSVLEAFAEIVDKYNLEWETSFSFTGSKITSRKIHIKKIGTQANSRLEFGKNIVKFERKILPENIVTALYGYGKGEETETGGFGRRISFADINGGLAYVTNEEARQKYGIGPVGAKKHIFGFFIDEEETDKAKLLESTKKELERVSQAQAEYTIEAVNLHIDCDYGDMVPAIDDVISFEGNTRIIKAIVEGDDLVFVFGHVVKGFTDSFQKEIQKAVDSSENKITSIMETRLNQISDIYFGEDGYNYDLKVGNEYNLPAGLYSFDAPIDENPTKVIYFGAGKLMIANSKKPDGSWKWRTAATGDGLVGDAIVTNSITANKLAADVGQELDISSNVAITSRVSKTEILTDPEIQEALKGEDGKPGEPGEKGDPGESITIKGSLDSVDELPPTANEGDVYSVVGADGTTITLYSYTGGKWINIGQLEGGQGTSVSKVTPQYYRSTSKTSVTGGSWGTTLPAWKKDTYIWTRLKIDYINPTKTEYTTEVLDTVNNALNEVYNSGVILPSQKPQLLIKLAEIVEEYKALNTEDNKKLDEWSAYESAYNSLSSTLSVLTNDMSATSELDPTNFKTLNETYAIAYNNLSQAIDIKLAQDLDTLKSRVTEAETKITDESILATVRESNEFASGAVTEQVSELAQTVGDFTASLETTQKNITDLSESTETIRNYFTFSQDNEGNPYTEMGSSMDALKLRQWRNRISFMNGKIEEAYFSNQAMHVKSIKTGRYELTSPSDTVFEGWYREE